ncbi:hypothetical protein BCAR13_760069 [Paraburkholderia caribensis]|nr:hypothetical protein BCAR13_760069 [Paraburkholderia caribensis]
MCASQSHAFDSRAMKKTAGLGFLVVDPVHGRNVAACERGASRTRYLRSTPSVSPCGKCLVSRAFHPFEPVFKGTRMTCEGVRVYVNLCAPASLVY